MTLTQSARSAWPFNIGRESWIITSLFIFFSVRFLRGRNTLYRVQINHPVNILLEHLFFMCTPQSNADRNKPR